MANDLGGFACFSALRTLRKSGAHSRGACDVKCRAFSGFLIDERAMTMSKNPTYDGDMDEEATWGAACGELERPR